MGTQRNMNRTRTDRQTDRQKDRRTHIRIASIDKKNIHRKITVCLIQTIRLNRITFHDDQ